MTRITGRILRAAPSRSGTTLMPDVNVCCSRENIERDRGAKSMCFLSICGGMESEGFWDLKEVEKFSSSLFRA